MQVLSSPSPSSPTARPRPVLSFTPLTPIVSPPSTPPNDLSPPRPLFPPAALAALAALSPSPSLSSSSSTSTADDALSSSGSSSAASFKSVPSSRSLAPHHDRSARPPPDTPTAPAPAVPPSTSTLSHSSTHASVFPPSASTSTYTSTYTSNSTSSSTVSPSPSASASNPTPLQTPAWITVPPTPPPKLLPRFAATAAAPDEHAYPPTRRRTHPHPRPASLALPSYHPSHARDPDDTHTPGAHAALARARTFVAPRRRDSDPDPPLHRHRPPLAHAHAPDPNPDLAFARRRMSLPADPQKPLPALPPPSPAQAGAPPSAFRLGGTLGAPHEPGLGGSGRRAFEQERERDRERERGAGASWSGTGGRRLFHFEADGDGDGDGVSDEGEAQVAPPVGDDAEAQVVPVTTTTTTTEQEVKVKVKPSRGAVRRYHALVELLTTEVGYLVDLRAMVTVYLHQLALLAAARALPFPLLSPSHSSSFALAGPPARPGAAPAPSKPVRAATVPARRRGRTNVDKEGAGPRVLPALGAGEVDHEAPTDDGHAPHPPKDKDKDKDKDREREKQEREREGEREREMEPEPVGGVQASAVRLLATHEAFVARLRAALAPVGFPVVPERVVRRERAGVGVGAGAGVGGEEKDAAEGEGEGAMRVLERAIVEVTTTFTTQAALFNVYEDFCADHFATLELVHGLQSRYPAEWDAFERRCARLVSDMLLAGDPEFGRAHDRGQEAEGRAEEAEKDPDEERAKDAAKDKDKDRADGWGRRRENRKRAKVAQAEARTERRHSMSSLVGIAASHPRAVSPVRSTLNLKSPVDRAPGDAPERPKGPSTGKDKDKDKAGKQPHQRERSAPLPRLQFMDYLIKPAQRICKYPLLLDALLQTPPAPAPRGAPGTRRDSAALLAGLAGPDVVVASAAQAMRHVAALVDRAQVAHERHVASARIAARLVAPQGAAAPAVPFVRALGAAAMVGALDVVHHHRLRALETGAVKAKYLGAFLYGGGGGYIVLAKAVRGRYELRHWFALTAFAVVDPHEDDSLLTNSIRLYGHGHEFELGASCEEEKAIWLAALRDIAVADPRWPDAVEPPSSLLADAGHAATADAAPPSVSTPDDAGGAPPLLEFEGEARRPPLSLQTQHLHPHPHPHSYPHLQPLSPIDRPALHRPTRPTLRTDFAAHSFSQAQFQAQQQHQQQQQPQQQQQQQQQGSYGTPSAALPPSRRSSTASVKAFFSASPDSALLVHKSSPQARAEVDAQLQDVFDPACLRVRRAAEARRPGSLFSNLKDGQLFSGASAGVGVGGAMGIAARNRLTKRESVLVRRKKSCVDLGNVDEAGGGGNGGSGEAAAPLPAPARPRKGNRKGLRLPLEPVKIVDAPSLAAAAAGTGGEDGLLPHSPELMLDSPTPLSQCSSATGSHGGSGAASPAAADGAPHSCEGVLLGRGGDSLHLLGVPARAPQRSRSMIDNVRGFFQPVPAPPPRAVSISRLPTPSALPRMRMNPETPATPGTAQSQPSTTTTMTPTTTPTALDGLKRRWRQSLRHRVQSEPGEDLRTPRVTVTVEPSERAREANRHTWHTASDALASGGGVGGEGGSSASTSRSTSNSRSNSTSRHSVFDFHSIPVRRRSVFSASSTYARREHDAGTVRAVPAAGAEGLADLPASYSKKSTLRGLFSFTRSGSTTNLAQAKSPA